MTTTPRMTACELNAIEPDEADRLRATAAGAPVVVAESHPGYPCRQCLRDAEVGEELVLVSYDPFTTDSPYRSASPIYLHREQCEPPVDRRTLPAQLTGRQLSVRAFDADAMMTGAQVVDGRELEVALRQLFDRVDTDHVHVHNASAGCWAVRVDRVTEGRDGEAA